MQGRAAPTLRHWRAGRRSFACMTSRERGRPWTWRGPWCGASHRRPTEAHVEFVDQLRGLTFGPRDMLEIAIVAYVLYRVLLLIHGTRAVQMLTGIVVLVAVYLIA